MNDADREAEKMERRNRLGRHALWVGGIAFAVALLGSSENGQAEPSSSLSFMSVITILSMLVAPVGTAIAAAHLTSSDSPGVRFFYAIAAGAITLVLVVFLGLQVWVATGGRIHM